jgi:hypothetical protein
MVASASSPAIKGLIEVFDLLSPINQTLDARVPGTSPYRTR